MNNSLSKIKNKYTRDNKTKQDWLFINCYPTPEFLKHPEKYFEKLSPACIKLLTILFRLGSKHEHSYPRQDTLAKWCKISREHVNRCLRILGEYGLIVENYRHMMSNLYKVSSYFNEAITRKRLAYLFPILACLPVNLLVSKPALDQDITRLSFNLYNITFSRVSLFNFKVSPTDRHITKKSHEFVEFVGWEKIPKNESVMKQDNPISQAIRDITEIKLTKWGQIRLMCFPDEAIVYARDKCKYANVSKIREPFGWFYNMANEYCTANNMRPDYEASRELAVIFKQPLDAKMILDKKMSSGAEKEQKPEVLSSVQRYKNHQEAERNKPQETNTEKITTLNQRLSRCLFNLTRLKDDFVSEYSKTYIESEMKEILAEIQALENG